MADHAIRRHAKHPAVEIRQTARRPHACTLVKTFRGNRMRILLSATFALLIVNLPVHANPAENDQAMIKLATDSGCMACHSILPAPRRADGLPPIAPAWRDIAIKYRDDPLASNRLTRTVMTGSNPKASHWIGKIGTVSMPPNAVAISEAKARTLVNWLLVLVP
ncbi:MAG: cytochrome C552 [Burkholderiaceae bacterium]|nr:cytochrome C552 [Burkholderiaceae bacterium]